MKEARAFVAWQPGDDRKETGVEFHANDPADAAEQYAATCDLSYKMGDPVLVSEIVDGATQESFTRWIVREFTEYRAEPHQQTAGAGA